MSIDQIASSPIGFASFLAPPTNIAASHEDQQEEHQQNTIPTIEKKLKHRRSRGFRCIQQH